MTSFFDQKFGKEGTPERIKAKEDVLSSCSGQILLNARKEAKWLWQSQLPYIRISYPCKNVSTLQPQPANHWKSEQEWLKGLIFKPFKPFSRDFPWFWLTVFSVNSCFRFTRLFLIWVDRFSVKFRFRFTVFRDGVSRWMVRRWMVQKVHGGYTGKDEGSKKPRFHRTIRHLGISVPATGFSILGTAISVSGTVGRGIAGGGEKTVNPNRKRRHDGIAASSTERVALTSKVNRFGKWSTFSGNGKPKAENNEKNGQPKSGKVNLLSIWIQMQDFDLF